MSRREYLQVRQVEDGLVRAWINYDGTSGASSIRASHNVTSLTDNGAGDFTITWARQISAASQYAIVGLAGGARIVDISVAAQTSSTSM